MVYFSATDLRFYAGGITASAAESLLTKSAQTSRSAFDIFLSHSVRDSVAIYGLSRRLEQMGFSVYVDWIVDRQLDRTRVSRETAAIIRRRMDQSRSLVYATSRAAVESRWMPWELGYFDARKGMPAISICPIETGAEGTFVGQEYLGLYKVLEKLLSKGQPLPYVTRGASREAEPVASFVAGSGSFGKIR